MPFIFEILRYSFCACVRHILKIVTFVIEKMKLASFSLFLDAPPLDPRCPLLYKYTTYVKGVLGLGGGGGGGGGRGRISERRHQISDKKIDHFGRWSFLLYINCKNSYTVHSVIGRLVPLFNGLVSIYVTE